VLDGTAGAIELDDGQECEDAEADSEHQPSGQPGSERLARNGHDRAGENQGDVADEAWAHLDPPS
jgi:hypothetical protein